MAAATATRYPFSATEWVTLKQCQRTLHKWAEDCCNGYIQYDDDDVTPHRYHNDRYGTPTVRGREIPDRSETAMERARKIAAKHGLSVYHQTDPRGCALYVYSAADLKDRRIDECYSIMARPII